MATVELGEDSLAAEFARRALAISTEVGYRGGAGMALATLGQVQFRQGDLVEARSLLERAVRECRAGNTPLARLWAQALLGWLMLEQADTAAAYGLYQEALTFGRDMLGGVGPLSIGLEGFAQVAGAVGEPERALRLAGAASTFREQWGPMTSTQRSQLELRLTKARAELGAQAAAAAFAAGRALSPDEAIAEAVAIDPRRAHLTTM